MRTALVAMALLCAAPVGAAAEPPAKDKEPVDKAVDRALEFLAATQDKNDGSWKSGNTRSPAVTSLAVMAFLSAGHVPGEGKYGAVVEKGVRWVLAAQQPNGLISNDNNSEMYNHGIATLMLAEVAGMVDGKLGDEVRKKLEKAVKIILQAQRSAGNERGGWRYTVQHAGGSDMSVTGWQVMALRACKNLGCDVPAERIDRAVDYIKRSQDQSSGGFRYTPSDGVTVPCTGTGILALELCGKDRHHSPEALKAGYYLIKKENLPHPNQPHFSYSMYYCSQATFQLGDNYWGAFKPKMHEVLLAMQKSNGSWPGNKSDSSIGPQYCTAMAVLALTVEYRYLPIYQRAEEPADKK
jgi:hypothetical protein